MVVIIALFLNDVVFAATWRRVVETHVYCSLSKQPIIG